MQEDNLADYAVKSSKTIGRVYQEDPPLGRSEFQRDRDRIIHSTAFRRLEYKTQVFVNTEGDLYRTRLTHSLEVAQIARSIARNLKLNEALTEAVALAHDLGHTPFGHAGQDALNHCMRQFGGFEHNLQSLRVVDHLEEKYAAFNGLNLCFETRESILKHCSQRNATLLGSVAERFLTNQQSVLEAQITNVADEIAYNNHDLDDGLRSGLLTIDQVAEVDLFRVHLNQVLHRYPSLKGRRLVHETVRRMINALVQDLLTQTQLQINKVKPTCLQDVKNAPVLANFSEEMAALNLQLKQFLRKNLYAHYKVCRASRKASQIIVGLFDAFLGDPNLLPDPIRQAEQSELPRAIADYIAGMTDRYAIQQYAKLYAQGGDF